MSYHFPSSSLIYMIILHKIGCPWVTAEPPQQIQQNSHQVTFPHSWKTDVFFGLHHLFAFWRHPQARRTPARGRSTRGPRAPTPRTTWWSSRGTSSTRTTSGGRAAALAPAKEARWTGFLELQRARAIAVLTLLQAEEMPAVCTLKPGCWCCYPLYNMGLCVFFVLLGWAPWDLYVWWCLTFACSVDYVLRHWIEGPFYQRGLRIDLLKALDLGESSRLPWENTSLELDHPTQMKARILRRLQD